MLKPHEQEAHARAFLPQVLRLARKAAKASQGDPESAALAGLAMALQTWDGRTSALSTWIYVKVRYALQHDRRDNSGLPRAMWHGCHGYQEQLPEQFQRPLSLATVMNERGTLFEETIPDQAEPLGAEVEQDAWLADVLGRLPERQQVVIRECVCEGRTQDAVGREIGISQMQVSREKRAALARLRDLLSGSMTTGGREGR